MLLLTIETDKTTSVSKTYEAACQFDLDGNILQTVDIYQDDDAGEFTYTNQEKVLVIVKNRCLEKFYETCRDGHELGIQNPFLTWHAFKKLQDHVYDVWPLNQVESDGCRWHKLVSKIWCPQCPLCEYTGTYPNLDLEVIIKHVMLPIFLIALNTTMYQNKNHHYLQITFRQT